MSLFSAVCTAFVFSLFDKLYIALFQTGAVYEDFYTSADLVLGAVVNVWGRKLVVCDCDDFTKEYYRTKFGIGK